MASSWGEPDFSNSDAMQGPAQMTEIADFAMARGIRHFTTVASLLASSGALEGYFAVADNAPGGLFRLDGSSVWQVVVPPTFASAAARDSVLTAPVAGWRAFRVDIGAMAVYSGGAWRNERGFERIRRVARAASQTIATGTTGVLIQIDTITGLPDAGGITYRATPNFDLEAPVAGIYRIRMKTTFAISSAGNRVVGYFLNGVFSNVASDAGIATNGLLLPADEVLLLAAADKIALGVWQSSGGNLGVTDSNLTLELIHAT